MSRPSKLICTVSLLTLIGCVSQTQYDRFKSGQPLYVGMYKAGTTIQMRDRDLTNCQVRGAQQVPQQQVVQSNAGITTPVQTTCNQIGTQVFCNSTGGQTFGGGTTVRDANAGLRSRVVNQCLDEKGYVSTNIPPCPAGVNFKASQALPQLSQTTCYIASPEGRIAIGFY